MSDIHEEFLENDTPILGQNYVCLSFVSPEKFIKQKELYMFHRYMTNKFKEYAETIDRCLSNENADEQSTESDTNTNSKKLRKLEKELKDRARLEFNYTYQQFNDNYQDFLYKHSEELTTLYDKDSDYKTSMRALKVRGVYETYKEAEIRAKGLQRKDRSFHVFVGTVGAWLPWDPEPDKVQNEEYLEDELNTLIQEYKKNQVHKDMLYEQEKQDRKTEAMKKRIAEEELAKQEESNKKNMETIEENLEMDDPWLQRQNAIEPASDAEPATDASAEPAPAPAADASADTSAEPTADASAEPNTEN